MELRIRTANLSDLDDIRQLNLNSWREAYEDILPSEKIEENVGNYPEERLERKINDSKLLFLVVEVDGKVIGTINFCWGENNTHDFVDIEKDEAQLRSVYIDPNYWGQFVGTRLFEEGLEEIPVHIEALKVESLAENEIGAGFYEKLGFQKIEESTVELFGDEYRSVIREKVL